MRHQTRPPTSRATLSTSDVQVVSDNVHFVHNTPTAAAIIYDNRKDGITHPRMHQFKKSLCPSSRGGPEDSKTHPTF